MYRKADGNEVVRLASHRTHYVNAVTITEKPSRVSVQQFFYRADGVILSTGISKRRTKKGREAYAQVIFSDI